MIKSAKMTNFTRENICFDMLKPVAVGWTLASGKRARYRHLDEC